MSDPRHHHFVPQFYLRGFADGVGRKARIHVIDLKRQTSFRTAVRNVAGRRDFNRIEADGIDPNALERAFGDLEGAAAQAIHRIEDARSLADAKDRNIIFNLIALLAVRNPRFRNAMGDFSSDFYKLIAQASVSTPERWESLRASMERDGYAPENPVSYEELRDFVKRGDYDITVDQTYLIGLEVGGLETILRCLAPRKWGLAISPADCYFITSDHPVVLIWTKEEMGVYPPGFGMTDTAVIFPISRRATLMGTFEGPEFEHHVSRDFVARNNSLVIAHAKEQIYAFDMGFPYFDGAEFKRGYDLLADLKNRSEAKPDGEADADGDGFATSGGNGRVTHTKRSPT